MKYSTFVYFIEADCGRVKIGCSNAPVGRFYAMSANSPCALRLLAVIPGTRADEKLLHQRFSEHRVYREWFHLRGDLAVFVDSIRGKGVDSQAPAWASECALPQEDRQRLRSLRSKETRRINFENEQFIRNMLVNAEAR